MIRRFNDVKSRLKYAIDNTDTEIVFDSPLTHSGEETLTLTPGDYFSMSILVNGNLAEIVHVTEYDHMTGTATVERGKEGTPIQGYPAGTVIAHTLTAGEIDSIGTGDGTTVLPIEIVGSTSGGMGNLTFSVPPTVITGDYAILLASFHPSTGGVSVPGWNTFHKQDASGILGVTGQGLDHRFTGAVPTTLTVSTTSAPSRLSYSVVFLRNVHSFGTMFISGATATPTQTIHGKGVAPAQGITVTGWYGVTIQAADQNVSLPSIYDFQNSRQQIESGVVWWHTLALGDAGISTTTRTFPANTDSRMFHLELYPEFENGKNIPMKYRGAWSSTFLYGPGEMVHHASSTYLATKVTAETPSDLAGDWIKI